MKKVAVITGASGGIGALLALRMAEQGYRLVLAARREQELLQVARSCGDSVLPVITDVRRRADVDQLRDRALAEFGRVDIWVNNAGRGISKKVLEVTDEDFDEIMAVNVRSVLYGMQAIVPHFKERGDGHLVNVSSFLSRVPYVTFRSIYSAAKAAVNVLTANVRMDLKKEYPGIHVSLVMPGVVLTDFAANSIGGVVSGFSPPAKLKPQTTEEATTAILGVIGNPRAEMYTNPVLQDVARSYYEDVETFEDQIFSK